MLIQRGLSEKLEEQRRVAEENDAKRRALQLKFPYLDLISVKVPTEIKAMELVKEEDAREALLVPLQLVRKRLMVAVFDPTLSSTQKILSFLKNSYELDIVISSKRSLAHAWKYYAYSHSDTESVSGAISIDDARLTTFQKTINSLAQLTDAIANFKSPLISEALELILAGALSLQASDIHLEAGNKENSLRIRIDGILHTIYSNFSKHHYEMLLTRIKLLSNLKINISDKAQDGRFTIALHDRDIEIRTSVIPAEFGETIVMRLLDPNALKVDLESLGLREDDFTIIKGYLEKPNGLLLNTGPTGSGKTTTLYAFLKHIYSPEIKIITIEDPVEYHLPGISQTQVDADAGYTFASGLRSILRQDPDVILVGEIRDRETADIAMNAALTGHLVFSTLHTNDAVGAIPRLIDLGAQTHVIGPALSLIIAQRLVRRLCNACKEKDTLTRAKEDRINEFLDTLPARAKAEKYKNFMLYKPKGCSECANLGYRGRISIFELFMITKEVEEQIYKNPTAIDLNTLTKKQGMTTMQEDGILKSLQGTTTLEEVARLTGPIAWLA